MTAEFMFTTFTIFLAGMLAVPLASRLGLGSVLGYLIAGITIGPVLHWAGVDVVAVQHFTEFGVVMMLFLIGLEIQPRVLWAMRARIFVMGSLQVGITALAVMAVAVLLGQAWSVALAIGLVFALSSTAIVTQTLNEKGLMRSDGGQASFSVLLFQDIAVIPMLALIPLLALPELLDTLHHAHDPGAAHGEGGLSLNLVEGLPGWQTALITLAAIGLVILAGRYLTGPIFRYVARARLRELFVSTALMMVFAIALLMTMVGLSPALGTFLAGVVMANSEYRHELESDIGPFKGIFLGVFFVTVGASIDFGLLGENLALVVGLTLGLIVLKCAVMLGLGRAFRLTGGDKWLFALGLAQAGEFGFVLVSFTVANAVIPPGAVHPLRPGDRPALFPPARARGRRHRARCQDHHRGSRAVRRHRQSRTSGRRVSDNGGGLQQRTAGDAAAFWAQRLFRRCHPPRPAARGRDRRGPHPGDRHRQQGRGNPACPLHARTSPQGACRGARHRPLACLRALGGRLP